MAKDCVQEILSKFPTDEAPSVKQAVERIVSRMNKEKAAAFRDGVLNPESAFREKAMALLERARTDIKVEKLKTLENIEKRQMAQSRIAERVASGQTVENGISALLVGDHKLIGENRDSVAARQAATQERLQASVLREVEASGLGEAIQSGSLDREIRIEISELNKGENGRPGISNSKEAMIAAKHLQRAQKIILGTLNSSGAYVRELDGWSGKITHDNIKIAKEGKESWIERILPLLDHEKTFGSSLIDSDPVDMLGRIYDDIVSGKSSRQQPIDASSDQVIRIMDTPANFAKRMERSRTLHFQDAAAEFDYLKNFGSDKTLYEETLGQARKAGKDAGMMQVLGTNPGSTFEVLMRSNNIEGKGVLDIVQSQFKEVSGETLKPGQSMMATVGSGIRATQSMAKLGMSVINSFGDLATRAHQLSNASGENYFSAWQKTMKSSFESIASSAERRKIMELTGVTADAYAGAINAGLGHADSAPGVISKTLSLYFKANLQAPWTNINKVAQARVLAHDLGTMVGTKFHALEEGAARNFQRFGIGETDWKFIQMGHEMAEDGRAYVGFQKVFDVSTDDALKIARESGLIPDGASVASAKRIAEKARFEAGTKLSVYYNDQVSTSMLEPGARERAMLLRGTHQDTRMGQVLRLFAQFKMFPTSMVTQTLESTLYARGATDVSGAFVGPNANKMGMAKLMVDLTILTYGGMVVKDLLAGKTPKDPSNPDTIKEAMIKSGVGGLYGDFLFNEFDSRIGRGPLAALAGPSIGQLDDIFNLKTDIQKFARGEKRNFPATATARLVKNNLPGANLFYTKWALDHFILNEFNERMNPGYMARMEARMRKSGQKPLSIGGSN